jgi:PAS domain S-box-containing protein
LFDRSLGGDPQKWPPLARITVGGGEMSLAPLRLGLQGEVGVIVAGSRRADFPGQTERLVLSVAANQAAIGLQQALLLCEQRRVAGELGERVAHGTSDLVAANEALKKEVSERVRAEEALRDSEGASRLIVDNIPGVVAMLTPTGDVEIVNRQAFEYFGQTLEDLRQWGTNGTIHPEDLPHVVGVFAPSIETGSPYKIVQRLRRADGVYRWFENSGFPLRDAEGRVLRWCVLLTDIDERKRAEEALKRNEYESRLTVDSIPGLIAVFTPGGEVEFVNRQTLEYFGRTWEELKRWGTGDTTHPEDLPRVLELFHSAIASGEPFEWESRARRFDGVYRWVQTRGFPLRDTSGHIVRWYNLIIDIEDRKRGEFLLRESERQFKAIFDAAGTGITLVDLAVGEPVRNNRALQKMLGRSEEELSRFETYDQLTDEADREKDATTFRELCAGARDSLRIEKHFILQDAAPVWANVIFTLLRDDDGQPRYIIAIHEDITEQKLALEKLQANQDLLDLAQKSAGAMAFDWYVQEEINYWSPEQEALFGLAPGTFDGTYRTWKKMMYAPDWPTVVGAIEHAHQTGKVTAEYRVVWPDGSLHWLSTNGRMFFDEEGRPLRMVGFTSNVTRRKLVEEELRRSEAFLAEGQHLARMGNFSWCVATEEIIWSEQLYRIFEFESGIPMTLELIATRVHPEDIRLLHDMVDSVQRGVSDFEYEHRLLMPDSSIKHVHLVAHGTRDEQGRLEYIGAVQDVTQRRFSEAALNEARSELARVARATSLGVLTASIAHEVNQPLSGIITNASTCVRMLDADPPNVDGARETARRTIRDGHRAADVIKRLRALFGKKDATAESVDLNDAAREVIALSLSELQRSRVILRAELTDDLPLVIGDRVQLQQVMLNLLLNASDAMNGVDDRPRKIVIRTGRDEGDSVRLSVQDTGVGLDPQDVGKLFEAFYTTKSGGMGIGLSVSRSIIESHHGCLWATPNDGPGATFSFSIPRASRGVMDASSMAQLKHPL